VSSLWCQRAVKRRRNQHQAGSSASANSFRRNQWSNKSPALREQLVDVALHRGVEIRVEFLGHGGAGEDRAAFEYADFQAAFGEVVLMLDLDISTVYKSSALILL